MIIITMHSLNPGNRFYLYLLLCFAFYFFIIELIIFIESDYDIKSLQKVQLITIVLNTIYCLWTLIEINFSIDKLLPFINFCAWLGMILEL